MGATQKRYESLKERVTSLSKAKQSGRQESQAKAIFGDMDREYGTAPKSLASSKGATMKSEDLDLNGAYTLGLSDDETFIIVRLEKPLTSKITKPFANATTALAARGGTAKFLIDARGVACGLNSLQAYLFAQYFLHARLLAQGLEDKEATLAHKLSLVVSRADDTYTSLEIFTRNRGIDTRLFVDYDDAVSWIKE